MMAGICGVPVAGFTWDEELIRKDEPGPWLRPVEGDTPVVRRYPVMRKPSVLSEFVRLGHKPGVDRILRFANHWGWLGEFRQFPGPPGTGIGLWAESLSFWLIEVLKARALYETWEAIRDLDRSLLGRRVMWHKEGRAVEYRVTMQLNDDALPARYGFGSFPGEYVLIASDDHHAEAFADFRPGEIVKPARYYLHRRLSERLRGHINPVVLPFAGGRIRFFPDSLLSAIYLHFAREVTGAKRDERECENPRCRNGGYFLPGRRDQRHCDKNCRETAGYHRRKEVRHHEQAS